VGVPSRAWGMLTGLLPPPRENAVALRAGRSSGGKREVVLLTVALGGRSVFSINAHAYGGLDAAHPSPNPVVSEPPSFAVGKESGPGPLCRVSGSRDHARGTK
jgi:hypothetical protein